MEETYHFIGIGGVGMSGLAHILLARGKEVTGSDIAFNSLITDLINKGARIEKGHSSHHVKPGATIVYTSDIQEDNPEFLAGKRLGCKLLHRSEMLAELLYGKKALAIAGTHGKTTTSSLLATVLEFAGWHPSFAVGGVLPNYHTNAQHGKGDYFVVEADESDRSFLNYHPFGSIVTNIDNDHLNYYDGSMSVLAEHFKKFMTQVKTKDRLFWCRDDNYLSEMNLSEQSYGFHPKSAWKIIHFDQKGFHLFFNLEHRGQTYPEIEIALAGRHNVLNAAAVFGLSLTLGVPEEAIRRSFKSFKGVLRRCEEKGVYQSIRFIDDYAHHPTEIQTTLEGIRKGIGKKRLIAVFQPHRYSRTQDCKDSFGKVFDAADELIITDIFGAGEKPIPSVTHALIANAVEKEGSTSCRYVSRSLLGDYLSQFVKADDVVVTLGAGDITKLSGEVIDFLNKAFSK